MNEYTKGKWEADVIYGDHYVVFASGHAVADCFGNEANARLIEQAPDMYRLLQDAFLAMVEAGVREDLRMEIDECLCRVEGELCPTDKEAWE